MIKYNQTINSNSDFEIPKITGYKKQFSIELPRGEETQIIEQPEIEPQIEPQIEQPQEPAPDFTEDEMKVLLEDGSSKDKSRVASKYLQKKLGLTKDQAAALVGVWQAESGFKLNAENQAEKAGKSKYVKKDEFGIGIGQ